MKPFIVTLCLSLTSIAIWNYETDPTGIRRSHYQIPIPASHVLVGNNINERKLKKQMLEVDSGSTTFIVGSSRVLYGFESDFFNNKEKVLNLGVGTGSFLDYQYFLNELLSKNHVKQVVIELTPWTFPIKNENNKDFFEISCPLYSSEYCHQKWSYFKELFTYQLSLESWKIVTGRKVGAIVPESEAEKISGYTADGRRHSDIAYLSTDLNTATNRAMKQMSAKHLADYETGIDYHLVNKFCTSIKNLISHRIHVHLLILPNNPIASQIVSDRKLGYTLESKALDVMTSVEETCSLSYYGLQLEIINFRNFCAPDEFYDAQHFKKSCFLKIKNEMEKLNALN